MLIYYDRDNVYKIINHAKINNHVVILFQKWGSSSELDSKIAWTSLRKLLELWIVVPPKIKFKFIGDI